MSSSPALLLSQTTTTRASAQKKVNRLNVRGRRVAVAAKTSGGSVGADGNGNAAASSLKKSSAVVVGSLTASSFACLDAHAAVAQSNPAIADVAEAASALATYSVIGLTVAAIGVSLFKSFGSFILPGKRASASHILVADESLAISLKERLLEGPQSTLLDRFAKEASAYSTCPSKSKGGDLGEFKPGQMVREFDTVVFEAPLMELQGPVKTQFGYHLILVTDRTDPSA